MRGRGLIFELEQERYLYLHVVSNFSSSIGMDCNGHRNTVCDWLCNCFPLQKKNLQKEKQPIWKRERIWKNWLSEGFATSKLSFRVCLMVFNTIFNNISVISWRSVLLVEETGGPVGKELTCRKSLTNFIT